jgi:hypothetical protein
MKLFINIANLRYMYFCIRMNKEVGWYESLFDLMIKHHTVAYPMDQKQI